MNNITSLISTVKGASVDGWDSLKTIASFLNYIIHPSLAVHALWQYTVIYSFWICLFVAMFSMVFYTLGFKKCAKFIPGAMAFYTLIKMIASAI